MLKSRTEIDFTKGPLVGNLFAYTIPMIFTGLFQTAFNVADMAVVGKFVGNNAFAAIGSTSNLIHLVIQLFMGLSIGITVVISRFYGARDDEEMKNASHTAISIAIIGGIILSAVGILVTDLLLTLMNSPPETFALSSVYIKIYFCAVPMITIYNFAVGIMRAYGDTQRPMYYLIASGILNLILNLIFVIVFHMGVAGVAIATLISQILATALTLGRLSRSENACRINLKKLYIRKESMLMIIRYGLPSGIQSTVFQITGVLIQTEINTFGAAVMAARGAVNYIDNITSVVSSSFCSTATTMVSQNYGAKNKKRIMDSYRTCFFYSIAAVLVVGCALNAFCGTFVRLFTNDTEIIEIAKTLTSIYIPIYFLATLMGLSGGSLRGIGYSVLPMIATVVGTCVFRVIWLYTVFDAFPTIKVLYACYPVAWVLTGGTQTVMFLVLYKKLKFKDDPA